MEIVARTAPGRAGIVVVDGRIDVAARPEVVWDLISDVRRMGEWSPACTGARGAGSSEHPMPGVRFRGTNAHRWHRWTTTCTFVAADAPREIAWVVTAVGLTVSQWGYRLTKLTNGGTQVTETWRDLRASPILRCRPLVRAINGTRDVPAMIETQMRGTLPALKQAAEALAQRGA